MSNPFSRRVLLLLACVAWGSVLAQNAAKPSETLSLQGGALRQQRVLSTADLGRQPPQAMVSFVQSRGEPGHETRSTARGVRLAHLIEQAGLTEAARVDWKNLLVTVTATDGYRAMFTWAELINTPAGQDVLVLFERDGQPLDAREGRMAVLATGDLRLGPRHVRNAMLVEVRPAD